MDTNSGEKLTGYEVHGDVDEPRLFLEQASGDSGPSENDDEADLAKMGKVQVLRRSFGFWSALGLSMCVTITWEGSLVLFAESLYNGGPTGVLTEYAVIWVGFTCVIASVAELASIMPVAGGQYHWVAALAPPGWRVVLSYITGWQTTLMWQATTTSTTYLCATLIQGLAVLNYPDYEPTRWQATLLMYAVLIPCVFFNTVTAKYLSHLEGLTLILHLAFFPCILIPLLVLAPHGTASELFDDGILNGGGYDSAGLTFLVGSTGFIFAFLGADAVCHISEETKNPSRNVPIIMVATLFVNGLLGFAAIIAVLFSIGNLKAALDTRTGYPFMEIFTQAVNSVKGSTAMASLITTIGIVATLSVLTASSRMTWAFARDKGLPGSRWLGRVEPRSKLPLWAILLNVVITVVLAPIDIGSTEALNAFLSLSVAGNLGSFILPIVLAMWRRIQDPQSIPPGKFSLGWARWPVNIFGLAWVIVSMFFSFWPSAVPVTSPGAMNWSCLLYGVLIIFATLFYVFHARHVYRGPIVETNSAEHAT